MPLALTDNKTFWKNVKPLFSDKQITCENITLVENNHIISEDRKVAQCFGEYFDNAIKSICMNFYMLSFPSYSSNPVIINIIEIYKNHPSVLKIKSIHDNGPKFSFSYISMQLMKSEIQNINTAKSSPINSVPSKIIKMNSEYFADFLCNNINNCIYSCTFPDKLKLADIIPTHKSGDRMTKNNYRPVSILPSISKIYEKHLYNQLNTNGKLSKLQCGFRKGFSAQHCLIVMIEKWKKSIDQRKNAGALLTDYSKAFDCISHNLLIAKLEAYGVDTNSLYIIHSYLTNRYQRVRVNGEYSSWFEIIFGVPQGSILGPLIFNIYVSDYFLFVENSDIASYADDNTPYSTEERTDVVINSLEKESRMLLQWLESNYLKANPDKFRLLLNNKDTDVYAMINNHVINNSEQVKLLGITLDNDLTFNMHVSKLCKKASQKVHALSRVCHYMTISQRRIIMKAFIESQFGYCPLVCMLHSRTLNLRINKIHERALRLVCNDSISTFKELLRLDKSFTIQERNVQSLAIEVSRLYIIYLQKL